MAAQFDKGLVDAVDKAEEIDIETQKDGKAQRTIIWVVTDGGDVYVRSVRGPGGKWYQRMKTDPAPAIHVDKRRVPVRSVAVTDKGEIDSVSHAFRRKYATSPYVDSICKPETLPTTIRLEPA